MSAERKGGVDVAPPLTLGATAKRLRENGYRVVSALAPDGRLSLWPTPSYYSPHDALISEHPVAVSIDVLILLPIADRELDKEVRGVLTKHNLLNGPVRVGSDGAEIRPLNLQGAIRSQTSAVNGAVEILRSAPLPLDGSWTGSLLDVPLSELPRVAIPDSGIWSLFEQDLYLLPERLAPKPPRRSSKLGFVGM